MYTTARRLAGLSNGDFPIEYDIHAAKDLFQRCIDEQNHAGAMFDLAQILERENSDSITNFYPSIALYERYIAESNSTQAKFLLAEMIQRQTWGTKNPKKRYGRAIELYESCVEENGDRRAMFELAKLLSKRAMGVKRDMSRALDLYEVCIGESDDFSSAVEEVLRVFMSGADGVEKNIVHAFQILETYINERSDAPLVMQFMSNIGRREGIALRSSVHVRYVSRLLERCVEKWNDVHAMAILARILFLGARQVETDISRAFELCATVLELGGEAPTSGIASIANDIICKVPYSSQNALLAVQICELCIEKNSNNHARVVLAQILIAGAPGVERDVNRAMSLCARVLERNRSDEELAALAEKIYRGTDGMTRDVQLAVRLCEMCIEAKSGGKAAMILAEIFMIGGPGIERDRDRAVDLCEEYLDAGVETLINCDMVINLAMKLVYASFGASKPVLDALQLLEMCIEKANDSRAALFLAEVFLTGAGGFEKDIDRGMKLCEKCLDKPTYWGSLISLADKIVHGGCGIVADVQLAVQLFELCIEKHHKGGEPRLAAILLTGAPGVEKDVNRGMKLCEKYLSEEGSSYEISELVKGLAFGRHVEGRDMQLGMKLCELWLEKKNDPDAMITLANILMCEAEDGCKDIDRAKKLLKDSFHAGIEYDDISYGIYDIAFGKSRMAENVPLAIDLCEMLISRGDQSARVMLGTILISKGKGADEISRGLQLFQEGLSTIADDFLLDPVMYSVGRLMDEDCEIAEKTQVALQLIEGCISMVKNSRPPTYTAVVAQRLLEIAPNSKNIERVEHLCQLHIGRTRRCLGIAKFARNIAFGTDKLKRNTALAIKLCKICIKQKSDPYGFILLAEIFITGTPELKKDVSFAMELCKRSIAENKHFNLVVRLAMNIANGTEWMVGDAALAVEMCEMCVAMCADVRAMVVLSQIYSMGGSGVKADMHRAHEWYERAVDTGWLLYRSCSVYNVRHIHHLPFRRVTVASHIDAPFQFMDALLMMHATDIMENAEYLHLL